MGAAGDMLTAALLELLPSQDEFIDRINALNIPGVRVSYERVKRCGVLGTHMHVTVHGKEESEINDEVHHHVGEHHHGHHHSSLEEIHHIINSLSVSEKVRHDACAVYDIIAAAESKAHGVAVADVHFHEVGSMDAVTDIVSVCMLMEELSPDRIEASPVNTGFGEVRCAHGILPVPAPATADILKGIPVFAGEYRGEMCTPTGAALIKYFVDDFVNMPGMVIEKMGYGMGTKEFERINCVRAILGEDTTDPYNDIITELSCNIDDMTGEELGYAAGLLRKEGALDVYFVPAQMKKNRPGLILNVLCTAEQERHIAESILKYTTTLGVRKTEHKRYILDRKISTVKTPYGDIRIKHGEGYGISKDKPEYDDIAAAAEKYGVSPAEIRAGIKK